MNGAAMDLRQLQYFVVVAEELHFGRAAERLHIVQSAVTQQIQRLERQLGVQLFDRSRRQVQLTDAGTRVLPAARRVLDAADGVVAAARGVEDDPVMLRLGTASGLGRRLDAVLERLTSKSPVLRAQLARLPVVNRLNDVRSGRLDAAFARAVRTLPGLRVAPLWQDDLMVALPCTHPLGDHDALRLGQLADLPLRLVPHERNPSFVDLVVAACNAAGFDPVMGAAFTTLQDTLAELGQGVPAWTVVADSEYVRPASAKVRLIPLVDPPVPVVTALVTGPAPSSEVELLIESCREVVEMS
ncbi:LysR family transcriptional regulator [Saccharopolyspora taberi]|uniref:LysR family transcriptional regulator n=1 Tax=Saccharopolyspora taberi TaxID=60895 RepID=A0ABN3VGB4_9PSEU